MSIAKYLAKLAQSITAQGVLGSAAVQGGGGGSTPTVSAVTYPGNDTAVNTAGGNTVTLTGTNFGVGVTVIVNGTAASIVTRVSATQLTFTAPAQSTGSYIIYVVNTDGSTALAVPGLQYSPVPAWTTAAGTLGSPAKTTSFTTTLIATGDTPITYSLVSGTLPSGITLNSSTGVLSGTTPDVATSTTYNFTVRSTDAQLQDTDRAFSITILPSNPTPTVEYLVVAGGGGGGTDDGGGGGAGGFRTATGYSVTAGTPITVTVGNGGAGSIDPGSSTSGSNSVFGAITSLGGGGGGGRGAAQSGGSGGGGYYAGGSAGAAGTAGQGNAGGNSQSSSPYPCGGGGGAGAAGTSGSGTVGGNGGVGLSSDISGTATFYAGGGGGSIGSASGSGCAGGIGGGGDGVSFFQRSGSRSAVLEWIKAHDYRVMAQYRSCMFLLSRLFIIITTWDDLIIMYLSEVH